jgi:hypothetical protein
MNPKRPLRRFNGGSDPVDLLFDECDGDRTRCLKVLRFFGPRTPVLKSLQSLMALQAEFGSELSPGSWLHRRIEQLEARP